MPPKDEMMCCPKIQKDIVDACVKEKIKVIMEDLDGDYFGILVDESKDISHKEQMALVLRYVDKKDQSLSPSQIRGQGYDGASNMQGELNGLKSLILRDTPSAYSTHCFAHQLQLTPVALMKKNSDMDDFFGLVTNVLNIVGTSDKRRNLLRQHQAGKLEELIISSEILGFASRECPNYLDRLTAETLENTIKGFDFAFMLHLMLKELNNHFDVVSTDLFLGMTCLHPAKLFGNFDKKKIMRLVEYYPNEFDRSKLQDLSCQLDNFIAHVRDSNKRFFNMKGITDLAKVLVESELHQTWPLVYLLIKLTLILPVATASVERAFSSMNNIENELRNSMGNEFLNGCLVYYVERKIFATISNNAIIHRFQNMKSRRAQL
ncbi:uncharacterized protein LOC124896689 [Capsicum annuum]|uniref:uncharacterized protein LOC124896689 n=1 Tax=Capsicum annuum TaxID=4072 RepID=UPI001FB13616|nr:uncharacterized protein LOC124896689 [Capsicum annuum]